MGFLKRVVKSALVCGAVAGAIGLAAVLPAADAGAQTLCSALLNIEPDKGQNPAGGDVLEVGESVTFGVNILNGCKTGGVFVPAELSGTTTLQLTCATPSIPCAALLSGVLQVTSCVGSSNVACNVTDPTNAVVELTYTDACDFNPGGVCGTGNECKDVVAGPTTTSLATITATAVEPVPNFSGLFPGEFFAIANSPAGDLCSSAAAGSGQGSAPLYFPPVCDVEIDKTVSAGVTKDQGDTCDEETGQCRDDGSPCTDDDDCRIVGSATGWVGENVQYGIDVRNDGGIELLNCVVSDPNLGINTNIGNIGLGGVVPVAGLDPVLCQDHEGDNTATVTCECGESGEQASDTDTANLVCLEPGLDVTKTCEDTTGDGGSDSVTVTAGNNGTAYLVNCQVVDTLDLDNTCPANSEDQNVPVVPATYDLDPGDMQESTGSFGELADDACNTVEVCCNIDNEEGGVVIDPTTGQPKLVCATDDAPCTPVRRNECLTRTPGFWGTHPHITTMFLPLDVCGLDIDNVLAATNGSAIEDMCFSGRDFKAANTSPQQLQLIRQCMAAELNVAASTDSEGECGEFKGYNDQTYDINEVLGRCCEDLCTSGAAGSAISSSGCIDQLDAFNNSEDTFEFTPPAFVRPGPAQPGTCQEANGNGFVNPRTLGPK